MTNRFSLRTQLLTGVSAAFALLAAPAFGQTVDATAPRSAVNQQSSTAPISTDIDQTSGLLQLAAIRAGSVQVTGDSIASSARANSADTSLTVDGGVSPAGLSPSSVSVAGRLVSADADALVANDQTANAPISALALRGDAGVSAGLATTADLAVTGNDIVASASGNQAGNTLSLAGANAAGGAIVSAQNVGASSGVSALDTDTVRLQTSGGSASRFDLSSNEVSAAAIGNRTDDALSVDAGSVIVPRSGQAASFVPASGDDPVTVNALYADLGSQSVAGKVSATTGATPATFGFGSTGGLSDASVQADDNVLGATATANRSSHGLDLHADSLTGDAGAGGPTTVANLTNVQRDRGGDLVAATNASLSADITGGLDGSTLEVARNAQTASATANRADGNLLMVEATTIDTSDPAGLGHGVVGTAMTGTDGAASTTAAFSVQNAQETSGASVIATMTGNKVGIGLGGLVYQSTVTAEANTAASAATANSAVNGVSIAGGMIRSSVDLNNSQTVDGQLRSNIGTTGDRAGVSLMPLGGVGASTLRVSDNSLSGSTVANSANNSLAVSAATLDNGSGHQDAAAGTLDEGYGAAADVALANYQKLGQPVAPGSTLSGLATTVVGAFGIGGDAPTNASTLDLEGNSQSATAVGNSALDRLTITAASIPADGAPAAGAALSSSQFGEAAVTASSDLQVAGRGGIATSSLSMTGNANRAVAAINDADNGLSVDTTAIGAASGGPALAEVGNLGSATISGDHVLSNTQFAAGSTAATAHSTFINTDADAIMTASRFDLAHNSTIADVSANHAVNKVAVGGVSGAADAGLANGQMNAADVLANASFDATLGLTGTAAPAISGSSVAIQDSADQAVSRGNSATNSLTLSVGAATAPADRPTARVGAFETDASAPALLVNGQSNYGAITARATSNFGTPLNATEAVSGSTLAVSGNSTAASAYGNTASNQLTLGGLGAAPGAMLVNVQSNSAPVTASVLGAIAGGRAAILTGSSATLSGNQLAATAIGNVATNSVSVTR